MTTESIAQRTDTAVPEAPRGLLGRAAASEWFRFLALSGQLAVIFWVIRSYSLEGRVFDKLAILVWAGFTVHYFLPARWRLQFFGLLSAAGILVIFGPLPGAWLLGIGLAIIGICHLPIRFGARLAVLLSATVVLGAMRVGKIPVPWSAAVWPVLGSMFALRIIIYLYDLKHRNAPLSFWRSAGYFFMLPNVVFPLFPVVDYQTFCRTHDDDKERTRGYQIGIDWMVRGTVQLILYRLIYQHLPIDTTAVRDVAHLLRYLLWPFLLYLNVSGLFHLVTGMLRLFGFNLPETNRLYYLASSFTDLWRRINIYWKDFMMKIFYYPAFFGLRRLGNNTALVLGTLVVFLATWALHSWQWFWIRGAFLLKGTDVLFWVILAVLVATNVVVEANRPMLRRLGSTSRPWKESVRKGFQALGVFLVMCVIWSLWVSDSFADWISLFSVARKADRNDLWLLPVVLGGAALFLLVALYYDRRKTPPFQFYRHAFQSGATLLFVALAARPAVYNRFPTDVAGVVEKLKSPGLNSRDAARRQRDYYEKLNDVGWDNPELAKVYMVRPADWGSIRYRPDLVKFNEGLPYMEMIPNARGRHRGAKIQFNRWGMRDRDYPLEPAQGVYRIALLGGSHTAASGVAQGQGFESLVEDRLNREDRLGRYKRAEILDFAAEGYSPLDVLASMDKVMRFKPHAVLYVVHQLDAYLAVLRLSNLLNNRAPVPYPELLDLARAEGVEPGSQEMAATRALASRRADILAWAYGQLAERCRSRGIVPLMAYLPILTPHQYDLPVPAVLAVGRESGFLTLDLSGVYGGHDPAKLQIAVWDDHPNVTGHQLVAERLYAAIRSVEDSLWRADEHGPDQGSGAQLHPQGVSPGGGS